MARSFLIIDGYNLLHAVGLARKSFGPNGLERARQKLIVWLANHLDDAQRSDMLVVFDAGRNAPVGFSRVQTSHGIRIQFAPRGSDADSEIEEILESHASPKQVILVSSDHRLHKAARRRRAAPIDSEKFVKEMIAESPPENTDPTPEERRRDEAALDHVDWRSVFGDIPGAADLQRERTDFPDLS